MPVRRAIAAESDAALLAGAKMDPVSADLHALFALVARWKTNRFDRLKMGATGKHIGNLFTLDRMNRGDCEPFLFARSA
jgi:hypothetical protein